MREFLERQAFEAFKAFLCAMQGRRRRPRSGGCFRGNKPARGKWYDARCARLFVSPVHEPAKMVEAAGVEPASEDASTRTSTRVGTLFEVSNSPAAAGLRARQVSAFLGLHLLADQEAQSDCVGTSWLQTEAASTVVTWFYQAARATALSFAVAWFAHFYVALGATTRNSSVFILVETVTPPCQRTPALWGA